MKSFHKFDLHKSTDELEKSGTTLTELRSSV